MRRLALLTLLSCAHVAPGPRVIEVHAKRFLYTPATITLKLNEPVVLELYADDREHGFDVPDLDLEADLEPGKPVRLPFTPTKAGRFEFHCSVFCGSGHEGMTGEIVVQ
ncbi:MAG: cupredoxin domain-containing protein [Myxococcaceae bacterium]